MRHAIFGFAIALLIGCAGIPRVPPDRRVGPVRLVHGVGGPEVDRLLDGLYQGNRPLPELRGLAQTALAQSPQSGAAHEAAGYLATLADDPHEAWLHFWQAAQDLESPLTELYLWEMNIDPTRAELEANVALYDAIRTGHPRPSARAAATMWQIRALRRLGKIDEARALLPAMGFIDRWAMLGSFDNEAGKGFLTAFAPEKKIDFDRAVDGPLVPLRWRELERTTDFGSLPLAGAMWPREEAVAYVATWVRSDAAVDARLRLTTGVATRVWLDGGLVLSEERLDGGDLDNLVVPVRLQQGWNQLLIKSAQKSGSWWLQVRLTDRAGIPLGGLSYSAQPQPFPQQTDSLRTLETPPELSTAMPRNRRTFLAGRWAARNGQMRQEERNHESFLEAAPGNLLAAYYLSLAYWANDESGKTIDLLNRGADRVGSEGAAFLRLRARYYVQRRLYDKAQADFLQEMQLTSAARIAERDLADLFGQRGWRIDRWRQLAETARKWPDNATAVRDLGNCELALGYTTRGTATLERALELEPGALKTLDSLTDRATSESRLKEARRWLNALVELEPTTPAHLMSQAELARREGRPAEAESLLQAAVRFSPVWPRPHERLGDLYWEQGRKADALVEWKLAHERDPNNSVLAARIEFHEPTRLGFIEQYLPGADAIDAALRRKIKPHPGAQAAYLLDDEVTEVNADGSARRVVTLVSQALTEQGRDALITHRVPELGMVKILQAYSLSKNNERQEASSIRGGSVRFRNLEVGSRVILQYVHYAPAGHFLENHFVTTWSFRLPGWQKEWSRWVLVLAKDRPLRTDIAGPVKLEETVVGDRRVRIWSVENAPPLTPEPYSPPMADLLWRVSVSTVPDWDEYVRWERALLADAFQNSPRLEQLAARLTTGATSPRDKLDRLFRSVTQDIRYQQDYENTVAGVRPHASPVVLERGYGDCKDKAVLLIQLAKLAGVKLKFAILRTMTAGKVLREVPNQQFNHAIVYVPVQPGIAQPFFMDPTADGLDLGNLQPVDQGALSLVLDPDSGAWEMMPIPYDPPELSSMRLVFRADIKSPTEAHLGGDLTVRGGMAMVMRHTLRNKTAADKALQTLASRLLPGATLGHSEWPPEEDTAKPVTIRLDMDASRAIQATEDHFRFPLPHLNDLSAVATLEHRETPIRLGVPEEWSESVVVTLPQGFAFLHTPGDFTITHPCFSSHGRFVVAGTTGTFSFALRRTCSEISVEDYDAFRDRVRDTAAKLREAVSFAQKRTSR
jgi:tetratricopeptide (TPR) repeat protein